MTLLSEKNIAILKKQWRVIRIPLLLAIAWAFLVFFLTPEVKRSFITWFKDFITGLFFIMWFVGQFQRTSKEINDNANYSNLQTGINDLKDSIKSLGSFQTPKDYSHGFLTANSMITTARKAVDNGYVLAGLMQAGVALEQAILAKADKLQIPRDNRTTVVHVINNLKDYYDRGTIQEFFAVWKLRNQLVHLSPDASKELENNPRLIKYFEWAINKLEAA